MKHKNQRVGIFIDIQNLYHSAKNLYRARVNYRELIKELIAGRQPIRTIGYVVKSDTGDDSGREGGSRTTPSSEAAFFDALQKSGVELRIKDLQVFADGLKKANWDVGMAVDAIRMAGLLDVVILVTGDGDFVPLVDYLKWGLGREVEVAAFGRTTSAKLKETADSFIDLERLPRVILKK
ncbi:NYN domain-containing protein [Candidatus Wolfebacteria bacterium]|nr:NYN domain-containing protein [Candidatus Wolfebacteria bacterium]